MHYRFYHHDPVATAILLGIGLVVTVTLLVSNWAIRRDPIMQKRFNAGSDKYFAQRGTLWQESMDDSQNVWRAGQEDDD